MNKIGLLFFFFWVGTLVAQQDTIAQENPSKPLMEVDSIGEIFPSQVLQPLIDTIPSESEGKPGSLQGMPPSLLDSINNPLRGTRGGKAPPPEANQGNQREQTDRPEGGVEYGSQDSSRTDIANQIIHLYGKAYVRYDDFEVTSDYIAFDLKANEVEALSRPEQQEKPTFKNGDQVVDADKIRYNLDSEKGIVHGARIQQDQFFIHGAVTKFVRAGKDSLHIDDVVYNKNAVLTTCDKDHPHWGIRTTKLKLIPDKLAVIGPFDMEVAGIPTPLAMPFAFAPLFSIAQSTSGVIFPTQVLDQSRDLGLGIRGLGYYFALSDKFDLRLNADIYFRGSFNFNAISNYHKRYKYRGAIDVSYSRNLLDISDAADPNVQKSYRISIRHNQDTKAHPYRTIGGNLTFTINDYDRRNYSDAQSQLNSVINSNFSYNYRFANNISFSTGIAHSQNTQNRSISFTLPTMRLNVSKLFPFKSKSALNKDRWFEKINMSYVGKFENKVTTIDTILFTQETLDKLRNGFSHELEMGASYKLLDHFNFNTNASYDEFWYFQTYRHTGVDSTQGRVNQGEVVGGFNALRDLTVSANLTTNIFGTVQFAKGKLRGIRHQMTPSIGLSYSPSTEGRYEYLLYSDNPPSDSEFRYNPFRSENGENLIFSKGLKRGGMSITYNLANTFEGKMWSKKDSTEKKFKILNSLNFSGNYNLQADSLKWSKISMTANARLFKGKSTLSIRGLFDPYQENERGIRVNRSAEGILRLDEFTASLSTQMTFQDIRDLFRGSLEDENQSTSTDRTSRRGAPRSRKKSIIEQPELFSWFEGFRISHIYRMGLVTSDPSDPSRIGSLETKAHSIQLTTGSIPLTDKWGMSVGNLSYDLKNKRWVYPSFTLSRDLHCWRMEISWQPQLDTYTFFIGVKASPFSEYIKYQSGSSSFERSRFR